MLNGRIISKVIFLLILCSFMSIVNADDENIEEKIELPTPPDKALPGKKQVNSLISKKAKKYKVERALVRAIVNAESAYNAHAVSPKGAIGLMQVMPKTAADYGIDDPSDLFDPNINVDTGTRHLKRLLRKYNNDYIHVIMAYNAGEGTVDRTNNVTYTETINYTAATIRNYKRYGGSRKLSMIRTTASEDRGSLKHTDPSLLSLSLKTTLPLKYLDPGLHSGYNTIPMFVLEPSKKERKGDY